MRCLVFLQAGKYFFFIENSTVGFFSLACGTWASSDWGQWPLPEEVYLQQSAIGGCPRVSREEHEKWIICIKKKTFSFLPCESKVEHCLLSQIPWRNYEDLHGVDFLRARRQKKFSHSFGKDLFTEAPLASRWDNSGPKSLPSGSHSTGWERY